MNYFPIALSLKNKQVIVAGAGAVSQRKILGLLETGALIKLIAPQASDVLTGLANRGSIRWLRRNVRCSDIKEAVLVIAATDKPALNKRISLWARRQGIAVNVVDKPILSDFISPAVLRRKKALVAVYTDAKDPLLSRDLKNYLKERWDDFLLYRNRL